MGIPHLLESFRLVRAGGVLPQIALSSVAFPLRRQAREVLEGAERVAASQAISQKNGYKAKATKDCLCSHT